MNADTLWIVETLDVHELVDGHYVHHLLWSDGKVREALSTSPEVIE